MTIEEVKLLKQELEMKIFGLLSLFEFDTNLSVGDVSIITDQQYCGRNTIVTVKIEVKL